MHALKIVTLSTEPRKGLVFLPGTKKTFSKTTRPRRLPPTKRSSRTVPWPSGAASASLRERASFLGVFILKKFPTPVCWTKCFAFWTMPRTNSETELSARSSCWRRAGGQARMGLVEGKALAASLGTHPIHPRLQDSLCGWLQNG